MHLLHTRHAGRFLTACLAVAALFSPHPAGAALWLAKKPPAGAAPAADVPAQHTFYLVTGSFPAGALLQHPGRVYADIRAHLVDPTGTVTAAEMGDGRVRVKTPLKGHHWLFVVGRRVQDGVLHSEGAKFRFYNAEGSVEDSVLREIRGRTIDSKYGRAPVAAVPYELILQEPERDHHISCCLFSGDTIHLKVFRDGAPTAGDRVTVTTDTRWRLALRTGGEGAAAFEIPRPTYTDTTEERMKKLYMLLSAEHEEQAAGILGGSRYDRVHYSQTRPVMFHPSALEWAAKMPAFLTMVIVAVVFGFGVFLHRRRRRR